MAFLGFGRGGGDEDDAEKKRREQDNFRQAFETTRGDNTGQPSPGPTGPTRKASVKDRVKSGVHTVKEKAGEVKHKIKVTQEKGKLKRYRKFKEKQLKGEQARAAGGEGDISADAEQEVFHRELTSAERQEYSNFNQERRKVKAERREKIKAGLAKLSKKGEGGNAGGGLADLAKAFSIGSPEGGSTTEQSNDIFGIGNLGKENPFGFGVSEPKKEEESVEVGTKKTKGKTVTKTPEKATIEKEESMFGLGDMGKDSPFGFGQPNTTSENTTTKETKVELQDVFGLGNYGKESPFGSHSSPPEKSPVGSNIEDVFSLGTYGKNNPFEIQASKESNPFDFGFLSNPQPKNKQKENTDPFGIFGSPQLQRKKRQFERSSSWFWGEKPKKGKKQKSSDPYGLGL